MQHPIVGITCDLQPAQRDTAITVRAAYARAVASAGGVPVLLPPDAALADTLARLCDAFVLTGGDDPTMEPFGFATDPRATRVAPARQDFETALLQLLRERSPEKPVLGVCLGMQMMSLVAGGTLDQHLPDTRPLGDHWDSQHTLSVERANSSVTRGMQGCTVHSRHKQAVVDPGTLICIARAPDGVVEAVADPDRPFYLGVQWHPERTACEAAGAQVFRALIASVRAPFASARG